MQKETTDNDLHGINPTITLFVVQILSIFIYKIKTKNTSRSYLRHALFSLPPKYCCNMHALHTAIKLVTNTVRSWTNRYHCRNRFPVWFFFFSKWDSTFARRVCPLSSVRKQEKKGTAIHCYRHIMGLCHSSYCLVFKHLFVWWPRTRFTVALGCMMVAAAHPILIPIADR